MSEGGHGCDENETLRSLGEVEEEAKIQRQDLTAYKETGSRALT